MGADKKASSGIRAGRLSLLVLTFFFVTPFTVGQSRSHNSNAASGFVQENYATPQTAESTVTVTYTKAQIAGDTNIIAIGWNSSSSTVSSVTDSEGNSYQLAVPLATGDGLSETIYYAANINAASAGNNVVSVNFSAAVPAADIRALEYGGLAAASPFDVGSSASGNSSAANSGSAQTTSANDLIFGAGITIATFQAAGTGFTKRVITSPDGDIAEDEMVSTTGSYAATASLTSGAWLMQVAAFRAAGNAANGRARPTISSFSASPSQIVVGSSTTLSWNVANASSITITPGSFSTTTPAGSTKMSPTSTTVYTLSATNSGGTSTATTSVFVDTTPPTVPASLTASATGNSTISLTWAASTDSSGLGVAGYDIYRCTGASCTPSTLVGTSTTASYGDSGLAASTTYTYAVSAYDTFGLASAKSSPTHATTQNASLPTISSFVASPTSIFTGQSSTLSWSVAKATSLSISNGVGSVTNTTSIAVSPTNTTTYTLSATNSSGTTTATATVTISPDSTPPSTPSGLKATASSYSTISITWASSTDTGGPGLAGYNIYRCAGASCTPSTLIGTSTTASYGDSGLAASTTYTYAVAAYDTLGLASAKSSPAGATTQSNSAPTINSFTANPTSIFAGQSSTLSWSVTNATALSISGVGTVTGSTSTSVTPAASITYTLTATNTIGNATAQATIVVSADSTPPSTPAGLTAAATSSTISLIWAGSTDVGGPGLAGYNVYRCTGPSCTPSTMVGTSATASYTDSGLTASSTYTYAVAAYDALGLASAMSSPASATTEVATATPTLVQHVATAMEQNAATTVTIPLPNPAGSGNALILGVQFQSSGSVTSVSDNSGNSWVAGPTVSKDGHTMALYYALNVAAGTQTMKIGFAGNPSNVQAEASEFYNVAAASALDGSSGSNSSTTAGAITTSAAGDLIYEWGADLSDSNTGGGAYNATTSIAAGAGFTLLSADLQVGAADQFEVQPAAGEVTPTFTAPGTSTWGSLAIALQAAPGGTPPPPGIRIVHVQHTLLDSAIVQGRPAPSVIQFPSSGNLLVGLFNTAQCLISNVTDSAGNLWTIAEPVSHFQASGGGECSGGAQIVYAANAATGPTLSGITVTLAGENDNSDDMFDLFDVMGAAPAPFDTAARARGNQTSSDNLTTVSLTPSAANELVFNNTAIDYQTINGIVGTGYMFDADVNAADDDVTGPNATPNSTLDEDNGYAHIFEPSMGTATFVYTYNSPAYGGVQYWASVSAAFAQAGSTNSTPPSVPQNLVVSGVTTSSVALSWSASTDPNYASSTLSYLIYRNGAQIGTTVGGTTSYTDAGLSPATTYTYTVSASDPIGNASAQSQAVNAVTSSSPPDNQISRR
jgi:hypothetical protein